MEISQNDDEDYGGGGGGGGRGEGGESSRQLTFMGALFSAANGRYFTPRVDVFSISRGRGRGWGRGWRGVARRNGKATLLAICRQTEKTPLFSHTQLLLNRKNAANSFTCWRWLLLLLLLVLLLLLAALSEKLAYFTLVAV